MMAAMARFTVSCSSTRLRDDIHQRRLAALNYLDGAPDGGAEVLGIFDRTLAVHAHAPRQLRVMDVGVLERRADVGAGDAAIVAVAHALQVHDLLVVRAVVVHDTQHRDAVMGGGPQNARRVHQIAVVLDTDGKSPMFAVGERGPHGRGRTVPDSGASGAADELIVLVYVPQTQRPGAHIVHSRYQRPVFTLDPGPQLGRQARGADRACIP